MCRRQPGSSRAPRMLGQIADADGAASSLRDRMIVLDRAAGHADGADHDALGVNDWKAAREGYEPVVRMFDAE